MSDFSEGLLMGNQMTYTNILEKLGKEIYDKEFLMEICQAQLKRIKQELEKIEDEKVSNRIGSSDPQTI